MLELLKYGAVLPAAIAALAGVFIVIRNASIPRQRTMAAAGVGLGWLAASFVLGLVPVLPESAQAWQWLPALAMLAVLVGSASSAWPMRLVYAGILAAAAAYALVPIWEDAASQRWITQSSLGLAVFAWAWLDRPMQSTGGRMACLFVAFLAGSAAVVLELAGTGMFAQMAGALAVALLAIAWTAKRPPVLAGIMPVAGLILPGVLASGCFYSFSEVPRASYVLLAAAPLAFALPLAPGRRRLIVQCAVIVLVAATSIGLAYHAEPIDWHTITESLK